MSFAALRTKGVQSIENNAQVAKLRPLHRNSVVLLLVAATAWTAIGVIFALPSLGNDHFNQTLRMSLAEWWSWGVMTPAIVMLDRRLPFPGRQIGRRLGAHLLGSWIFTLIYLYVFTAWRAVMGVVPWSSLHFSQMFAFGNLGWFLWSWLICCMIVGGLQAWTYYERYLGSELRFERLEHSFSEARLNALRMQLDPHFLFNALNTISSHVERDPKLTRRMIEHLGDLLRISLESKDRQEVPLIEEISFLEHYLAIQKIRFGDQLKVEIQIAPEAKYAAVPAMVIQPLVENAIRHGISRRASGGTVSVRASVKDDRLEICVTDDGIGLPLGWALESSEGLGLSITRQRIAGIHPNGESRFVVTNRVQGGTIAEISLPMRVVGEVRDERAYA
jgi:two-component system LytT family sensor kinase